MQRIGFIGASGMMGHGMAKNLRAKGHPLALTVHRNGSGERGVGDACRLRRSRAPLNQKLPLATHGHNEPSPPGD